MSTEIATVQKADLMAALKNSLYPGASDESCEMVLAYCRAAGLDPLLKPVHIVPMWDSKTKRSKDIIMPGIQLYRINAERSSSYMGLSEPEFGPDVTETFPEEEYTRSYDGKETKHKRPALTLIYPKWCKITAKKMVNGVVVEFHVLEFWKENYATADNKSRQPNEMWRTRVYGQLAKCAEAQVLRKAFPDRVSANPTAEEMEGKFTGIVVDAIPSPDPIIPPQEKSGRERKKKTEPSSPPPQSAAGDPEPAGTQPNPPSSISAEEVKAVQRAWTEAIKGKKPEEVRAAANAIREMFGFKEFHEIKRDQLIEVMVAIGDLKK